MRELLFTKKCTLKIEAGMFIDVKFVKKVKIWPSGIAGKWPVAGDIVGQLYENF